MTLRTTIGPTVAAVALALACVACSSGGSSGLRSTVPGTAAVDTGGSTVPSTAAPGTNTLTATFVPAADVATTNLDKSAVVLRRRIGDLGIRTASVRVGDGQISVRVSGVAGADVDSVEAALVAPGHLSFHPVLAQDWQAPLASADARSVVADPSLAAKACAAAKPPSVTVPAGAEVTANAPAGHATALTCSLLGAAVFDGSALSGAKAVSAQTGAWVIGVTFNDDDVAEVNRAFNACYDGATDAGADAVCPPTGTGTDGQRGRIAVVSDGFVLSAPTIDARDLGTNPNGIQIAGQFTKTSAQRLALVLRAGALPVTFDPPAWHVTPN